MHSDQPMTWQGAEELAADYLARVGYRNVRRMPDGPDGGIDVIGDRVFAQVKHWATPVGIAEVQRHRGASSSGDAVFFSLSGYTASAVAWADINVVSLFQYDLAAQVYPVNAAAEKLLTPISLHEGDDLQQYNLAVEEYKSRKSRHDAAWIALITATADHFKLRPDESTQELQDRFMTLFHAEQGFNSTFSQKLALYREDNKLLPYSDLLGMLRSLDALEVAWTSFWNQPVEHLRLHENFFRYNPQNETWTYLGPPPPAR